MTVSPTARRELAARRARGLRLAVLGGAGTPPLSMDYNPIVMRCAPRASNGPDHLGLCAHQATPIDIPGLPPSLVLTYTAADGEEGFPGTVVVRTTYTLTDECELKQVMQATVRAHMSSPSALAAGETVILVHPSLPLVGVSTGIKRGSHQTDSLADG